ncbi:hypothetical protein RINTU1_28650 [Candidatus Regiella insecticola]|uniref:Uncharacterized protein n=1 Tax=Candidatus Regiella insecticola TaxID=138073 RepID=A0A6L2ZRD5_9ENTR|nr:hypothetical protein RINTU1_28650 [Candidatus Regiella insecticola]
MRSYTHTPWPRLAANFKDEGDTLLGLLDCRNSKFIEYNR